MSNSFSLKQKPANIISIIGIGVVATMAGTLSMAQYNNGANNANNGLFRTNTIQECASACGANATCASWVYYTSGAQSNMCQFTISQQPLNIAGAISGAPNRNPVASYNPNNAANNNAAYQAQYNKNNNATQYANNNSKPTIDPYQGNYGIRPLPNYNEAPKTNVPQNMVSGNNSYTPPTNIQNSQNNASISFTRPQQTQQQVPQQVQQQSYNPAPQQYTPAPQYNPQPKPQITSSIPTAANYPTQVQQYNSKVETVPVPNIQNVKIPEYAQQNNTPPPIQYQNQAKQNVPQYSIMTATQNAVPELPELSDHPAAKEQVTKPAQIAANGPLRPQLKDQYDKYRGPDGMVDAAAMRRDMIKTNGANYSVESEWANIAQNPELQGTQIFENSAPIPLPSEIKEDQVMKEVETGDKPKKKSLWSKMVKRDLSDWDQSNDAQNGAQSSTENTTSGGPLRKQ